METKPLSGRSQHLLLILFLLFCFGGVFYTYYKPTKNFFSCPNVPVSKHEVCTDQCLIAFIENFTQSTNTTGNLNYTLLKQNQILMENNEENQNLDTIMLIWSWPFGFKFDVKGCSPQFGIKGCQITDDRSQYHKAHGVMFHHRDIGDDLPNLQKMPRPPHQKWVWMNWESPDNSARHNEADHLFNLTANYQKDSDVWVPYGRILEASEKDKPFEIPPKDKIVCWIVSNWNPNFRRVKYFNELNKHIKVEAYGRHFNRYVRDEDYNKILSSCKFYLSFENSIHKDYFTEKLFKPLKFGTVPVVLGPPRENYEEFIPAESFIHVDDFKSPQELAEHLTLLDKDQKMYEQYFTWRQYFTAVVGIFGLEHACLSCDYIRNYKGYRVFKNLNKWYWD
ncbi:4-galactosyl-N-acetylglucosaminide 3-alpha-L-fucosyltransferase 9-like [Ictalurus furcatus]|uniref:4-galactosyl-N-acetylglucosaminide 3-alpha-L-fucosyltransferase 9-like n=1 Tax=Ictalurus furcatus TaxID=66913 RepID=UPI00234FBAAA|nr:4-galactosyl-N-acetylglucosaminide 3-alpha-L-fucosyltransferase 9-like [Ictalurus furcatus]XP_053498477.1 4-galactosyl-N-acetylglucosaminide 3-alpha-L-fucosyltransferase 9-like [Ictalurus furcatus]XP_053498478.1 4-galactosyl-N-acetylglucosaminide 3-alpha-L-fucosyltransferase 9-like [Ictalurus furcatus]XP_053498479.1 4-galactosyl-N-acetylglucosaminide 3-alpha-L-fucosyltransferase 9-like [Ictalurus furcatus]XP_053498480.1 4-galactosyl-N-acetylglucosaminide 3-alpha-L-fucosyltransferase 9-like [